MKSSWLLNNVLVLSPSANGYWRLWLQVFVNRKHSIGILKCSTYCLNEEVRYDWSRSLKNETHNLKSKVIQVF